MNLQGLALGRRISIWSILLCFFWSWNSAAQSYPYFLPLFSTSRAPIQLRALGAQGSDIQSWAFGAQTQIKNWSFGAQGSALREGGSSFQFEFTRFGLQFTPTLRGRGSSSWQIQTWAKFPGNVGSESTDLGVDASWSFCPFHSPTRITGTLGGITRSLDSGSTLRWRLEATHAWFDQFLEATASLEGSYPSPEWVYAGFQTAVHLSPSFSGFVQAALPLHSEPSPQESNGGWVMLGFQWSLNSSGAPSSPRSGVAPGTEWSITDVQQELHLIKIEYGTREHVTEGQSFDVYRPQENETPQRIARARVEAVKSSEAILAVVEYFQDQRIEKDFVIKPHDPTKR